jgi:hypothetical protein
MSQRDVVYIASGNIEAAAHFLEAFGTRAETGIKRALRRSLNGMSKDAFEALGGQYRIKARDVRKAFFSVIWANPPAAQGSFTGRRIPLIRLAPRPASITKRRPPGGVSILKAGQRESYPQAFLARMTPRVSNAIFTKRSRSRIERNRSGAHLGVFERVGRERLPIKERFGPSVAEMLDTPESVATIQNRAGERFEKNLRHEIDYVLGQEAR